MERIHRDNIFHSSIFDNKKGTINRLVSAPDTLHSYESVSADAWNYKKYLSKTICQIKGIYSATPFALDEYLNINVKQCLNSLIHPNLLRKAVMRNLCVDTFVPI